MLEKLEELDWSSIQHSHDTADEFPKWLRQLASPKRKVRRRAMYNVSEFSNHQTSVYPVSVYVIPFLIELVQYEEVQDREQLLDLLANLGWLNKPVEARFDYPPPPDYKPSETDQNRADGWVRAYGKSQKTLREETHQEVAKGLPVYLNLLDNPDIEIRLCTIRLLAGFPDLPYSSQIVHYLGKWLIKCQATLASQANQPAQQIAVPEKELILLAQALLTFSYLAEPSLAYLDFLQPFLRYQNQAVASTVAVALARLCSQQIPLQAIELLLQLVENPKAPWELYRGLSLSKEDILKALCNLHMEWNSVLVPLLFEVFPTNQYSWNQLPYIETMLQRVFTPSAANAALPDVAAKNENLLQVADPIFQFDSYQETTLLLIAQTDELWSYNTQLQTRAMLAYFGLPANRSQLQVLLQKEKRNS